MLQTNLLVLRPELLRFRSQQSIHAGHNPPRLRISLAYFCIGVNEREGAAIEALRRGITDILSLERLVLGNDGFT